MRGRKGFSLSPSLSLSSSLFIKDKKDKEKSNKNQQPLTFPPVLCFSTPLLHSPFCFSSHNKKKTLHTAKKNILHNQPLNALTPSFCGFLVPFSSFPSHLAFPYFSHFHSTRQTLTAQIVPPPELILLPRSWIHFFLAYFLPTSITYIHIHTRTKSRK